jgi:hypothetical protein
MADGEEHTLYFLAKTPTELALFAGADGRYTQDEKGDLARQKNRAKFIGESLCEEDGTLLLTSEEALLIPPSLKTELCALIFEVSNTPGEAGKV